MARKQDDEHNNSKILGFIISQRQPDCREHIMSLGVQPGNRRSGVASLLLQKLKSEVGLSKPGKDEKGFDTCIFIIPTTFQLSCFRNDIVQD